MMKNVLFSPLQERQQTFGVASDKKTIILNHLENFQNLISEILQIEPKSTSSNLERKITDSVDFKVLYYLIQRENKIIASITGPR